LNYFEKANCTPLDEVWNPNHIESLIFELCQIFNEKSTKNSMFFGLHVSKLQNHFHEASLRVFQWYQECEAGGCCALEDFNVTIQKERNKTNKSLPSLIHGCFL
jgi:hypothetical protein